MIETKHKLLNNISVSLACLFFLLSCINVPGQEKAITLNNAINMALKNNRDIEIAKMEVKKADAAVGEAFGYALPSVDVSANFSHFLQKPKTSFPDFGAMLTNATYNILFEEKVIPRDNSKFLPVKSTLQSFAQTNSYEATVQVTQTLFNSAVFRGIGASQIYLNLSREQLKDKISTTVLDVKKAFYGVLLTKKLYEITKASYDNAKANLENVTAMHKQGLVSDFDQLQTEVNVENIRPTLLQMENSLKTSKDGLKILIGLDQSQPITIEGDFKYIAAEIPGADETIASALKNNFSIKTLKTKLEVDDAFIDLDRSEYWPSLAAFGNYSYAGSADNLKFNNYSSAIVGLSFSINLFKGRQTSYKVEQSLISYDQTKTQLNLLKDGIATQVKGKILELNRVKSLVDAEERNVNLAQKAYDLAVVRYKEGTGSQLEIQNADLALRQARINRIQSIYSYIVTTAELDQLLGKVDPQYFSQFNFED